MTTASRSGDEEPHDEPPKLTPTEVLAQAAKERSARIRAELHAVIDGMEARGEKISAASVERAAGVSRWLVYQEPFRTRIVNLIAAQHTMAVQEQEAIAEYPWLATWDDNDGYDETPCELLYD
jgi:hypothetical protein